MDHVAIMRPAWGLTDKIKRGEKTIESRWYKHKFRPWNNITAGDTVYFKDAGKPVTVRAKVRSVRQFEDLTPQTVHALLVHYGTQDGIKADELPVYFERFKDKQYCMLIFLEQVEQIPPIRIRKAGFGAMAAWVSIPSIDSIREDTTA